MSGPLEVLLEARWEFNLRVAVLFMKLTYLGSPVKVSTKLLED